MCFHAVENVFQLERGPTLWILSFSTYRVSSQCSAGLLAAAGHSKTKERIVPPALGRVDVFVQGDYYIYINIYYNMNKSSYAQLKNEFQHKRQFQLLRKRKSPDCFAIICQVTAMSLSPFIFNMDVNVPSIIW